MKKLSSIINNSNLNDFLKPSQSCVITANNADNPKSIIGKEVKINLSDCLACSGCVTSAESILLSSSNIDHFSTTIKNEKRDSTVAVFICNQTFASLAAFFKESIKSTSRKIVTLLKQKGVDFVFNLNVASEIMVTEVANEFLTKLKENGKFPLLTSSCPGWVCYAEKMLGEKFFPYMSRVQPAQCIMARLIRRSELYHKSLYIASVMSCYDKRLEASRLDGEIDCVITTDELSTFLMAEYPNLPEDFKEIEETDFDQLFRDLEKNVVIQPDDCSGSLLYRTFMRTFEDVHQEKFISSEHFIVNPSKLRGHRESVIERSNGTFRFAYVYGFRNIHNLIQRIKQGRCDYHFVEIMACSHGCLGGGGQISGQTDTDQLVKMCEEESNFVSIPDLDNLGSFPLELRKITQKLINVTW